MKAMKVRVRWRAAVLGTSVGVVSMVSACAAAAGMMAGGAADPALMGYWAAGILVGAGLLGSLTALLGGGPADAALSAVGELMVLLGLNWALNGAQVEGFAVTCLALAGGSGAAIMLTAGKGRSRVHRRRKRKKS